METKLLVELELEHGAQRVQHCVYVLMVEYK